MQNLLAVLEDGEVKSDVRATRNLAIERACYCPMYRPSKIRIQEYFVCDPVRPNCDLCRECPINGLREPQTMAISYNPKMIASGAAEN
ncbi:MAG TPA: hypothetical protein PLQ35_04050 [bacterium]|nr:hypothetical protein [bacterium]HQL61445.1 hypothetical protein [bacterium]